jgi:AIPR protein
VNTQIEKTLDSKDKALFWLLNNGLSIICKDYAWTDENEQTKLKLVSPQIVNGCQTVATLAKCESKSLENIDVLVRIIKTDSQDLSLKITQATNTQNPNYNRDLDSNLEEQVRLQTLFAAMDVPYFYERKRKEFRFLETGKKNLFQDQKTKEFRKVENDKIAGAYLSFAIQDPTAARAKARFFFDTTEDYYGQIFYGKRTAEEYLLPLLISRQVETYIRGFKKRKNAFDDLWIEKKKLGKNPTNEESSMRAYFDNMEALPYAKTHLVGPKVQEANKRGLKI